MKLKRLLVGALLLLSGLHVTAQDTKMNDFISQLMARMTVEEKLGQMNLLPGTSATTGELKNSPLMQLIAQGKLGTILNQKGVDGIRQLQDAAVKKSRLGIPLLVGMDVIHGYETIFPIPLGMSCSWDLAAIEQAARIAAKEATADGICWTYSPMVDIALDARWGRIAEGNGEDPFLGSRIAEALVRGYQGNYGPENMMACVKHYALYGGAEAGRDYNTVDMSHIRMYNQFFPPYQAAAKAGAGSFMTSFNIVDYTPATANRWLIDDVLRKQWQWDGFVVTDYGAIAEMMKHGLGNLPQVSALALKAGTDMDMCAEGFIGTLEQSLKEGKVTMAEIDQACRRVLEAKYKLGLFQNPYRFLDKKRRATDIYTTEHKQAARNLAAESFVLLKNQDQLLPLKKQGKIALIGPMAHNRANMAGTWAPTADNSKYITLKEAMEQALAGKATVSYAQGCNFTSDSTLQKDGGFYRATPFKDSELLKREALAIAKDADVIVCAMGESAEMSGESSSRATLEMFDVQRELLQALLQLDKPVVVLNFAGRPTVLSWEQAHVPAILQVWFGGSEAGDAICDVLFGDKVPSGKLTTSMPQVTGQEPLYYNYLPTGRPVGEDRKEFQKFGSNYFDVRNDPLYPFGYGLSYTTFAYSDVTLNGRTAQVTVTNTGNYDADEIVQLYIHDVVASITRPVKELKGFERIHLKKGESKVVKFEITDDLLKFYNSQLEYVLEPGDFEIMIGPDSSLKHLKKAVLTIQ
ncbi:glycosyl hydrolase [Xylanibacter ruminicola]|jgi:beta-glucosidase|uniref:Periplasmic beta-glucosidase n=2 Tax=Xylanibacter ruminicola TaxID=839 RepID=D5EX23_XYLR2|nr:MULTISPECIES: beta-glucosidase BglX [Prevotellaceae]MBR0188521.1 beta-glucosidase BglX [Prevotella sp.]ADE82486.1 beta-glucosidase [Xylanibacter ruminicola 23]MBE6270522.1 beta-glucosidase BglX [Xylanibacter ruminicola]QVJ81604.1 beta-glucosidase BglX [Xylanibacter ruminicola]SDQ57088.1 beta-glucosidase [Prevotella sp. khp1]